MNASKPPRAFRSVSIVLPAKNEAHAIGRTLRTIPTPTLRAMGLEPEVIVLDGHSTDETASIARRWGATVIEDEAPGKGNAFRNARPRFGGDVVVMLDADGTYAADAIPRLLGPIMRGDADVVLGHRRRQPGSMTTAHFLGNKALTLIASTLNGRACHDLCTGMWAFTRPALMAMPLRSQRFGLEAELFSMAARLKLRLVDVRVDYLPRTGSNKLSFGHDGLRILRRLMRARLGRLNAMPPLASTAQPRSAVEVRA